MCIPKLCFHLNRALKTYHKSTFDTSHLTMKESKLSIEIRISGLAPTISIPDSYRVNTQYPIAIGSILN